MSEPVKQPQQYANVVGRVTKDPATGTTKSGDSYIRLNIAADSDTGETVWLDGVAYGLLARNLMDVVKKGSRAKFKGRVKQREYTKKDGTVGVSNNFSIDSVTVSDGKKLVTIDEFTTAPEPQPSGPAF